MLIFIFKHKTAYEMRISDWSSDVCSSDLAVDAHTGRRGARRADVDGHDAGVVAHLRHEVALLGEQGRVVVLAQAHGVEDGVEGDDVRRTLDPGTGRVEQEVDRGRPGGEARRGRGRDVLPVVPKLRRAAQSEEGRV